MMVTGWLHDHRRDVSEMLAGRSGARHDHRRGCVSLSPLNLVTASASSPGVGDTPGRQNISSYPDWRGPAYVEEWRAISPAGYRRRPDLARVPDDALPGRRYRRPVAADQSRGCAEASAQDARIADLERQLGIRP